MSSLAASAAAFKKQAKTAEIIPRFKVQKQDAEPDPFSQLHEDESPRKRARIDVDAQRAPIHSQPAAQSTGQEVITQMHYAMQYLKEHKNHDGKTSKELEGYLSLGGSLPPSLVHILRRNERIHYDSQTDKYAFRPVYNVRSAAQLLTLLARQATPQGLAVKDLKEGWPLCLEELDRLEHTGEVLLIRQKKDDRPKTVWPSSLDYATPMDADFSGIFRAVTVPGRDQLARELESLGLKPTSVDPSTLPGKKVATEAGAKQKKPNRRMKVTNTHMGHINHARTVRR